MDTQTILLRYARYYDSLQKLGKIPLSENPTLEDIEPTKGIIQSGYKEIREGKFDGNLIDYLCFISVQNLINHVLTTDREVKDCFGMAKAICQLYSIFPADVSNFLRLTVKKPKVVFDSLPFKGKQREAFSAISSYWFEIYLKETTGKPDRKQ